MLRVGQMLLAAALKRHRERSTGLGRGAEGDSLASAPYAKGSLEQKFLDDKRSPFSIFRFIEVALGREVTAPPGKDVAKTSASQLSGAPFRPTRQLTKKDPGDWFGPTTISETIAALVEDCDILHDNLAVYIMLMACCMKTRSE